MRYLLLGTTEALGPDGTPLPLGGARLRALLAALALRGGRAVPVRELVDDVYGDEDEPPRDAPAALQALVGRLRRVLGREAVEAVPGPGYRLAAGPEDIDLYVFERRTAEAGALLDAGDPEQAAALLRDALGLFRGLALADLPGPAGVRPEAQRLAALRRRVEADLRRGALDGLVPELTGLTATHPYDEGFHAQLIRALRAEGRHADALAAYETARRTLADALGADPGPELTALHRDLLTPPRPARPSAAPATTAPTTGALASGAPSSGAPVPGASSPGASSSGAPSSGAPAPGAAASGAPASGVPASAAPPRPAPLSAAPPSGAPAPLAPPSGAPAPLAPPSGAPAPLAPPSGASGPLAPASGAHSPAAPAPGARASGALAPTAAAPGASPPGAPAPPASSAPGAPAPASSAPGAPAPTASAASTASAPGGAPAPASSAPASSASASAASTASAPGGAPAPASPAPGAPAPTRDPAPYPYPYPEASPTPTPAPTPAPTPTPETGNIRPRLTSFVGREPELGALRAELGRFRLVTLTGPGGSGKTRLAEEAARQVAGPRAWIAELAPLDDPGALPGAVLSALRLREINLITRDGVALQDDPTAHLVEHLARTPGLLLVLDNCEHVIDAAAALAETLLAHCPDLRILATSREPLGVPGETVRPVEPLPPAPAHRLFTDRARAVLPDFDAAPTPTPTPSPDTAHAVAEICRRLDGLPLAIELAAARLRLLTPRQIADRLDDRFQLLTSGARTLLPRQQTLRAVVDWSWELLDPAERALLRRLSVFTGGWDLPAAEAVDAPAPGSGTDTLTTLGALVDKSLVVAAPADDGAMRYRLLETIHEYAAERAAETPELLATAGAAHTAHFTALAEEAEPKLRSREQLPWIDRLERDLDNIRAALHRTLVTAPDECAGLRLVFAMGWFWWLRNYRPEGLAWTRRALALGEDPDDPADARYWPRMRLRMLSFFLAMEDETMYTGNVREDPTALALVRRVRDAFGREPGPESARFPGLLWPFTAYLTEEPATVRALLDAGVETCRRYGGDWETGVSLMFRTHMIVDMPDGMRGVDEDLAELRALVHRVGDRWMGAQVASAAAEANMMRGRRAEAREAYEEALRLAREVGAHTEAPFLLARLAELTYRDGDTDGAERGLDEAARESERLRLRDAHAFVDVMRAVLALDRDDPARARAWIASAGAHAHVGTPPPHFAIALDGFVARIEAHEGAGPAAVAAAANVLSTALGGHCADIIVISLAEGLAYALHRAGDAARCARVAAAVGTWRQDVPRSVPERREAEKLAAACLAVLGEEGLAEARAAGAGLGPEEVLALVEPYTAQEGDGDGAVRSS
ncbi:AfsR/SARP family transcriptional regulator [Streptomyces sp. NPDC085460]|uniref:AfsR/SARP family transcriptional regulator n=1 Tax=Streptomyces sp. NPDC085460 TaxID=3365723 RepID=UPI0037D75541